jgi:alpha-galactosidase
MRMAMKGLREILGDKLILGCGVPLSSAFNLVDYCRIGPDVSLIFDDVFYMRKMHRERISTKITIQNTIYRAHMDGTVFRCDPDVYLLRDDHIRLTRKQRRALAVLNHLCGSVYLTSDQPGDYDHDKRKVLREARALVGAEIRDIARIGDTIAIRYRKDEREDTLVYDRRKGELISG